MKSWQNLVIAEVRDETPRIRSYVLRHPNNEPLPTFSAGAHINVVVKLASGEDVERSYSISNSPRDQSHYRLGVLREDAGKGGSLSVHRNWTVGQTIQASNPRSQFLLAEGDVPHMFIAGGIGITPLLSMANELAQKGANWTFHYCARSRADAAFVAEIERLADSRLALNFDGGNLERGIDITGLLRGATPGAHLYVCGPRGLNEAVIAAADSEDWSRDRVHFEFFGVAAPESGDRGFTVHLQQSSRSIHVSARESILDALMREGIEPIYDCKRGECGLCVTTVVSGEVDHRDYVLSSADRSERKQMCICVSRAAGAELEIEL